MRISSKKPLNTFVIYLIMIGLGILSGTSGNEHLASFGQLISDIFIKIFRCISTPIIALSIMVTLATYGTEQSMTAIWRKTIFYTVSTTIIAATVSCLLYILIHPHNVHTVSNLTPSVVNTNTSYLHYLVGIIPTSVLSPFIEHQVMGVLLIGIVFGLAARSIPDPKAKEAITRLLTGLYGIFFMITKWIVAVLPIGLYGFITVTVLQFNNGIHLGAIGAYLLVIVLANLIQGFFVLPLWLKANGIKPINAMKQMLPALSVAFFSKSSSGTLPVTINTIERGLNLNPKISRFVLPLCTSLNMNGCAAFIFTTVIYLMQNHGVDITLLTLISWVFIATVAAIGNAGVPMGCFFLSASLLSSMDIPIVLLGIILPFYNLIDMVETALNVWSDSCVACVVNEKFAGMAEEPIPVRLSA